jgi:hypothetical protein
MLLVPAHAMAVTGQPQSSKTLMPMFDLTVQEM